MDATENKQLTAKVAHDLAVQARINKIIESVVEAVNNGMFELRTEKLTPEQIQYLQDNGFKVREIVQKAGSTWDINWEQ